MERWRLQSNSMKESYTAPLVAAALVAGMFFAGDAITQQFRPLRQLRDQQMERLERPVTNMRPAEPKAIIVLGEERARSP